VFTNLSQDHLDFHGSFDRYFAAKRILFDQLGPGHVAVVNVDDSWGSKLLDHLPASVAVRTFGFGPDADDRAEDIVCTREGSAFRWITSAGSFDVKTPWVGRFNVSNLLAAAAAVSAHGMPEAEIVKGLEQAPAVPGRLERVPFDGPFTVLVDYAHTDDALRNVVGALRPLTDGTLRVLIGCGGDRDRAKRPLMAEAACAGADDVVFTSDNPRGEAPGQILEDMVRGVGAYANYRVVEDRVEAISEIIHSAKPGDIVLLAGKGHETKQEINGVFHPFSDRDVALAALKEANR
jgi:UDP-N-acetylmuramoyl-L-alanyl-D-glutamate--2,6-diaminopimelate ligase